MQSNIRRFQTADLFCVLEVDWTAPANYNNTRLHVIKSRRLAPVDLYSIKLEVPLPFALVDSRGILLAQKGFVFETEKILLGLANHGNGFYVDFSNLKDPQLRSTERAYINQLLTKMQSQEVLGDLSRVQIKYANDMLAEDRSRRSFDWLNMVELVNSMLRTRDEKFFKQRLDSIEEILRHQLSVNPDEALMALFYLSEKEAYLYSATHCMLVCAISVLTASTILQWSESDLSLLMRCALTMNMGMVDLQDRLTFQRTPTDISQQFLIAEHSNLSFQLLEMFGVADENWLSIVRGHHQSIKEPLKAESLSDRMIGLLQRADNFSAKLSARASRGAQHSSEAMKSIYFDVDSKLDVLGAAIIKAVGIYRPGSFVKLASGEVALVIRRGDNTAAPTVAVVLNRNGMNSGAVALRNTAEEKYAVVASVPSATVNVTLNLEKILALSRQ